MRRLPALAFRVIAAAAMLAGVAPHAAVAQSIQTRTERATIQTGRSQPADEVKSDFKDVLNQYPPALGKMLKLDPGLMNNQAYLAPYPAVSAFIQQHPEVPRDPAYYLDFVNTGDDRLNDETRQRERLIRLSEDVMAGIAIFVAIGGIVLTVMWILRFVIEHRRWLRATTLQADMQNKLLERMSSSNELLSYVQSPAGQNLLQGVPVSIDPAPARNIAAPFTRILLSIQIGFILASGGAGLLVVRDSLGVDFQGIALVIGTIGVSLGVGFGLAAAASYLLSQKFRLFDTNPDNMRPSGGV
jgi:hypothetical protein